MAETKVEARRFSGCIPVRWCADEVCAAFKSAARRAKLPLDVSQHDLRHRRVTTWLAEGKNPVHVKEALGHADLATTMGYTHLAEEHLRGLVDQEAKREELRDLA